MIHARKVKPEYFEALRTGKKSFELRKEAPDEPRFAVGDYLAVNEYQPGKHAEEAARYTGRCLLFEISYILRGTELLPDGVAALSLTPKPLCWDDVRGMSAGDTDSLRPV